MNGPSEFFVTISVPSGQPEDLRVIKKPHWAGQGFIFSRLFFADEVRHEKELNHTGVYVLWGLSEKEQRPHVYIGEGSLRSRLNNHLRDKDFWAHGAAFMSKDLNKAHVQYLEARLLQLAEDADRCDLINTNTPQESSLSNTDIQAAEEYLTDMLKCLSIVGVNFFDKLQKLPKTNQDLFLIGKNIKAHGSEDKSDFIVRAGSQAVKTETKSIPVRHSKLRKELLVVQFTNTYEVA